MHPTLESPSQIRTKPRKSSSPKRAPSYLYLRGSIYYFRYAISAKDRVRLGHSEVRVSLQTGFLHEARQRAKYLIRVLEDNLGDLKEWQEIRDKMAATLEAQMASLPEKHPIGIDEIRNRMDAFLKKLIDIEDENFDRTPCCNIQVGNEFVSISSETAMQELQKINSIVVNNRELQREAYYPIVIYQLLANNVITLDELTSQNIPIILNEYHKKLQIVYRQILLARHRRDYGYERQFLTPPSVITQQVVANHPEPSSLYLSQFIEQFVQTKKDDGKWTERNIPTHMSHITTLLDVFGDVPIASIDRQAMRTFRDILTKLPPNRTRDKRYKDKTIRELLQMDIGSPLNVKTINTIIETISGMFEWGIREGLIEKNPAKDMTLRDNRQEIALRDALTASDIQKIFFSGDYTPDKFINPAYYWVPLISLYTGMRLEEICQLHTEDIYQDGDIWTINISENSSDGLQDKGLKTKNATRLIPIHQDLIELGLLKYREAISSEFTRLFPKLNKTPKSPKYGKQVGKQFAALLKKKGIEGKKSFHSLRHTFSDYFKKMGLHNDMFRQMFGHDATTLAGKQYGSKFTPKECYEQLITKLVWR